METKKSYRDVLCTKLVQQNQQNEYENYTSYIAIPLDYYKDEGKPTIKQIESSEPLSFNLMTVGNYYVVKDTNYDDQTFSNFVAQCVEKEIDEKGVKYITYEMMSNSDNYLGCKYIVKRSCEFSNSKFKRLPNDYWLNTGKYKNIQKKFYIDHVDLTGIY